VQDKWDAEDRAVWLASRCGGCEEGGAGEPCDDHVEVAELEAARYIEAGPKSGPSWYAKQPWRITESGRQWLAANDPERGAS
jgi:hypothetical protein